MADPEIKLGDVIADDMAIVIAIHDGHVLLLHTTDGLSRTWMEARYLVGKARIDDGVAALHRLASIYRDKWVVGLGAAEQKART